MWLEYVDRQLKELILKNWLFGCFKSKADHWEDPSLLVIILQLHLLRKPRNWKNEIPIFFSISLFLPLWYFLGFKPNMLQSMLSLLHIVASFKLKLEVCHYLFPNELFNPSTFRVIIDHLKALFKLFEVLIAKLVLHLSSLQNLS